MDLFTPVVELDDLHQNFIRTLDLDSTSVRDILEQWASGFIDRDGKFVKEFQTTYNSSFWELYLFAVLKHLNITVDFSFSSPDFVGLNKNIVIEATTANHAHDDIAEWEKSFKDLKELIEKDLFEISVQSSIRLSNALNEKVKKYKKYYRELAHVKEKPFIIAVSNYSKLDFNFHGDVPMQWLLYDVLDLGSIKKQNGAEVKLGLFNDETYSDISAVLYSSVATFGKARALSQDTGNFLFHAVRIKDNYTPIRITASKREYQESLCDGMRLFINPYAKYPIRLEDFNDSGIRVFLPDKNGNLEMSCHEDGDLCMRFVQRFIPKKQ